MRLIYYIKRTMQSFLNIISSKREMYIQRGGDLARDMGDWPMAVKRYRDLLALRSDRADIWLQLGHAEKHLGRTADARSAYEQALASAPTSVEAAIELGHLLHSTQDDAAALEHLHAVGQRNLAALDAGGLLLIADIARGARKWQIAAEYFGYFLEQNPNNSAILVQLGHAFKELGANHDALRAYQRAVVANSTNYDAFIHLSYLHIFMGHKENSYKYLKLIFLSGINSLDSDIIYSTARLARDLDEYVASVEYFEKYLTQHPTDSDAWNELATLEKARGNMEAAMTAFERAKATMSHQREATPPLGPVDKDIYRAIFPFFDAPFYIASNPDIDFIACDPIAHYHHVGWREQRDPSPIFSTRYYLTHYEDVANAVMDPLLHWVWAGRAEGRLVARPLDRERSQIEAAKNPRARALDWKGAADASEPKSIDILTEHLQNASGIVVSVSHDDYTQNYGGVQNLIGDEQKGCAARGWDYLHLSPTSPKPILADVDASSTDRMKISLNGIYFGIFFVSALNKMLSSFRNGNTKIEFVIHHLLGHAPECILDLIHSCGGSHPTVWIHDFFSLCPSYTLMRNDVSFCGAPDVQSISCSICCYGEERRNHLERLKRFFRASQPKIIAPSHATLDLWLRTSGMEFIDARVQPLGHLKLTSPHVATHRNSQPLRIAHIGARVFHKGWFIFQHLAATLNGDPRYEFLQLGADHGAYLPPYIRQVAVNVTSDNRDAMINAIVSNDISAVINWSLWPETFCYTVHEALAGGAFAICRRDAGNVWPAVLLSAPLQGLVLDNEEELHALFKVGTLPDILSSTRQHGNFELHTGSADQFQIFPTILSVSPVVPSKIIS